MPAVAARGFHHAIRQLVASKPARFLNLSRPGRIVGQDVGGSVPWTRHGPGPAAIRPSGPCSAQRPGWDADDADQQGVVGFASCPVLLASDLSGLHYKAAAVRPPALEALA